MTRMIMITEEENWVVATDPVTHVASQGKTMKEAKDNLKEALELFFEDNDEPMYTQVPLFTTMEVSI